MKFRDQKHITIVIPKFPGDIYYDIFGIEAAYCRMGVSKYLRLLLEVLVSKQDLISTVRKEVRCLFKNWDASRKNNCFISNNEEDTKCQRLIDLRKEQEKLFF